MAQVGFDPRASVTLWQNMAAVGGGQPPAFLSTHPSHDNRMEELAKGIEQTVETGRATRCPGSATSRRPRLLHRLPRAPGALRSRSKIISTASMNTGRGGPAVVSSTVAASITSAPDAAPNQNPDALRQISLPCPPGPRHPSSLPRPCLGRSSTCRTRNRAASSSRSERPSNPTATSGDPRRSPAEPPR
ncbi:hypothetical protein [Thiocapsa roseopersicina]|uniref:hypothetical protein n=1 Tax=Thiocapsa roseopersicina TaxID=1058 RepID=UPI0035301411